MKLSERIYRLLLKAYPKHYRQRYEEPMAQLFADQLIAADTTYRLARLWLRTLADLVRTLPVRYAENRAHSLYGLESAQSLPHVPWSLPAQKSVFFARCEASAYSRKWITTEDLLLGILREDDQIRDLLSDRAIENMRREIESHETTARREPPSEDLPLNAVSRSALALAKEEAPRSGAGRASTRHLLAGILQQEQTLAAQLLQRHGLTLERLRQLP
jgi:hypothetical protein